MNMYQRLLRQVTEVTRAAIGNMVRPGVVDEVKGDKMRILLGYDKDGQKVLSPWLNTANHRGGARERRFYKPSPKEQAGGKESAGGGQNVMLIMPAGDPRQAAILPYSPNKNCMPPDHANESGQDEETYQLDDLRVKKTKEGYDIWLQPPKQQQQQQGDLQQLPKRQSDINGQAVMKVRINKDGGITGRIGKDVRFAAHKKGSIVWTKSGGQEHYYAARSDQKPYLRMSEPPVIWPHGIPLDDK